MSEHTEDRMLSLCVQSEGSVIARVGGEGLKWASGYVFRDSV